MTAPLPNAIIKNSPANAPPLPANLIKPRGSFFISCDKPTRKPTKKTKFLKWCFKKYGLRQITAALLPNKACIFFWLQAMQFADFNNLLSLSLNKLPCISFIQTQSILCEKTKFALTLYKYYGNNAWNITPKTFHVCFNAITNKWDINNLVKQSLNNKNIGHTWITKTNIGYGGNNIFLFGGQCLKSLQVFLSHNYTKIMLKQINEGKSFHRLRDLEKYTKNNNFNGNDVSLMSSVIFQKYIDDPLLFDNYYKIDLRIDVLIATTNPCVLFYKFIKQRICATKYDENELRNSSVSITNESELKGHISNSTQARGHKEFDVNTCTINGRPTLLDYNGFVTFMYDISINKKKFDIEWFESTKYKKQYIENKMTLNDIQYLIDMKICRLLCLVYNSAKQSFDESSEKKNWKCQFAFHGVDIMIDENGKFWFLEVNGGKPAVFRDNHKNITKTEQNVVEEMIDIVMEIRQLKLKGYNVNQYTSLKTHKLWRKAYLDYKLDAISGNAPPIQIIDNILNDIQNFLSSKH